MARQQHDREDLLAEATALIERVGLRIDGYGDDVLVGFRRDASASVYFGGDRVYQFTSQGQLRRAHVGELLFKAERGRLVSLRRTRTARAVNLVSAELDAAAGSLFLCEIRQHLDALRHALATQSYRVVGQVPAQTDVVGRARAWLDQLGENVQIAQSPRAN